MTDFQQINLVSPSAALDHGQSEEDLARADTYGLIAELFAAPPSDVFFSRLAASPKPDPADDAPPDPSLACPSIGRGRAGPRGVTG